MATQRKGWKDLVREVVDRLGPTFSLADVVAKRDIFAKEYPNNRFIDAKIRQSLQILRDQGAIRFLGHGRYERLDMTPKFSPLIAPELAAHLMSKTQQSRVVLETWAEMNMYCLHCAAESLDRLPPNTPVADFSCAACESRYQLKSKNGRFGRFLTGAAYGPMIDAAKSREMPDHLLVEYDLRYATVVFVEAVPGPHITADRIIPRKRLSSTARRAGWQGCNIDIADLPRAKIVEPQGIDRAIVRASWVEISEKR